MTIGIDIDDTLTDTRSCQMKKWQEYIKLFPTDEFTQELPTNINQFGNQYISNFWDTYRQELSFGSKFKLGADIVTHRLHEDNDRIEIVTSRPDEKYDNLKENLKIWLTENNIYFDKINTNVRDKGKFCKENGIHLLADDSIEHCQSCERNNVESVLFNKIPDYDGYQTDDWFVFYDIVQLIKEKNRKLKKEIIRKED